CTRGFAYW
nr:immunoglobulin heavy chain junction region [Mus musculus]NSM05769.1 immunoglobulin heavy chain junction region [Mus musculus]NSM05944.1 immunoglobulin heavy chain junction region [Mus musculus]NSM08777.1 immunoglobulin heavy chain junction region [Mus musculus]